MIPEKPSPKWLTTDAFQVPFKYWREQLELRRDVFLGYCSSSAAVAQNIKEFLTHGLGLSVLDWAKDFDPATSILHQIEEASRRCGAGIFLFTKDDALSDGGVKDRAVPRDNVVFEAGFFIALKGKAKVLIVREAGAKMPADLGGDIYASLANKKLIEPIKPVLQKFMDAL
jgi:predicted nucleotide-binding protein